MDTPKTSSVRVAQGSSSHTPKSLGVEIVSGSPRASSLDIGKYNAQVIEFERFISEREVKRKNSGVRVDANSNNLNKSQDFGIIKIEGLRQNKNLINAFIQCEENVILKITNLEELRTLIDFLENGLGDEITKKIICLDLNKVEIDGENIELFSECLIKFFEKIKYFPEFKKIILGDIRSDIRLKFPDNVNELEVLVIGKVCNSFTLDLSLLNSKLQFVSLKNIFDKVNLIMPEELIGPMDVSIESIEREINFELESKNNPINLSVDNVGDWAHIKLDKVKNLKKVNIKEAGSDVIFYLGCDKDTLDDCNIEACGASFSYVS